MPRGPNIGSILAGVYAWGAKLLYAWGMKKPWRLFALFVFVSALFLGGSLGDDLLALTDETQTQVNSFVELVKLAHDQYGDEVTYRDLVYASIQGMLRSLDPHTSFLPPRAYDQMREKQQSSFYGLGIYVGMRNGMLTVITPIPGTPAANQGMRAGDVISGIDDEPTDKMNVDEAIGKLKGPKDTDVKVTVTRRGLDEPLDIVITRAEIPQNTVQFAYLISPETGYLSARDFSRSTGSEVARAINDLKEQGMKRLIFDLRNNGGGLLDQAIAVADQFVPAGSKIVETRGRIRSSYDSFSSSGTFEPLDIPLIVLVNSGSASASEIVAGAIQDHDVGLIVGEATWGKGLVQTVYNLKYGEGIALTTARYYTPSGRLIQRDYTSYWDYYTGYDAEGTPQESEPDGEDVAIFYTDLGREVYGGGGITPDHRVEPQELHPFLQRILNRSALFTFAIDYNQRHEIDSESWTPDQSMFDELGAWLIEEEYAEADKVEEAFADPQVRAYVTARMRFEIFNTRFGLEAGHRAYTAIDNQIQAAIELFEEAENLLARRHEAIDGLGRDSGASSKVAAK